MRILPPPDPREVRRARALHRSAWACFFAAVAMTVVVVGLAFTSLGPGWAASGGVVLGLWLTVVGKTMTGSNREHVGLLSAVWFLVWLIAWLLVIGWALLVAHVGAQ